LAGTFLVAAPVWSPKFAKANLVMKLRYDQPQAEISVLMREPQMVVVFGPCAEQADVTMAMTADIADRFWRGEYHLSLGLVRAEVKATGPVSKILRLVPLTKPLFPIYRDLVAEKDALHRGPVGEKDAR
jgi:hypothetical protein